MPVVTVTFASEDRARALAKVGAASVDPAARAAAGELWTALGGTPEPESYEVKITDPKRGLFAPDDE